MFAILGISLLGGRLGYCEFPTNYGVNMQQCKDANLNWLEHETNFNNIVSSMNTLFILSSLEGWPNIMYPCLDSDFPEFGPS